MEEGVPPSLNDNGNGRRDRGCPERRDRGCPDWLSCLVQLIVFALVITAIILLYFVPWKPSSPHFDVDRVSIIGTEQDHQLDITMKVHNPSVDIYHKSGGKVDLSYEGQQIASTEPHNFCAETGDDIELKISVKSSNSRLHQELTSTTKESKDTIVPLSLSATIPVKTDEFIILGRMKRDLNVQCEFKLSKTLTNLNVVSQDCKTDYS